MGRYEMLKFLPEKNGMTMAERIVPMTGSCVALALAPVTGQIAVRKDNHHLGLQDMWDNLLHERSY
jgi:hypothetical protein